MGVCVAAGSTLTTVGEYQKRLGGAEREFLHVATANFLTPLRNFLEGDWRTISVSPSQSRVLLRVPPPPACSGVTAPLASRRKSAACWRIAGWIWTSAKLE